MKKFMAVFTGSPAALDKYRQAFPDPEQRKAREQQGMEAWKSWVGAHSKSIVDHGAPLGRTKRVTKDGIADIRNNLAAFTIVEAASYEDAAKMFLDHPHFTIFPGDGVEIMECLPMPGTA